LNISSIQKSIPKISTFINCLEKTATMTIAVKRYALVSFNETYFSRLSFYILKMQIHLTLIP